MRLAQLIVRYRKAIMWMAVLLLLPSAYGFVVTPVNYDVTTYLPEDMAAKQAQVLLEESFGQAASAYVLLPDVPLWQAGRYKSAIAALPGVESVNWLDDVSHVSVPPAFMPAQVQESFLAGGDAVMFVQFKEAPTSLLTEQAIKGIREITQDGSVISGFPAIVYDLGQVLATEKWFYALVAVTAIVIVLSLSTSSTVQPLLLLVAVGFSVVYNMGSNTFMGSISFITQSITAVLQLAVSMDYGIFLIHRFAEEEQREASAEAAMTVAIAKTGRAISASALTTVAGFAAIILMRFGLGRDLGLVMAKGVIFSGISVLVILPGLLLTFNHAIKRYQHRTWIPEFTRLSHWVVKRRVWLVAGLIALVIPAYQLQQQVSIFYSVSEGLSSQIRSVADLDTFKQAYGVAEVVQLIVPDRGAKTERELVRRLEERSEVKSVISLSQMVDPHIPESFLPASVTRQFRRDGYGLLTVQLTTVQGDPRTNAALAEIEAEAEALYGEVQIAGEPALTRDLMRATTSDIARVNRISVIAITLIIALSFGSLSVPVLLVLAIQSAIWMNFSIAFAFGTSLYFVTYLVLGAIQLGATVDYAILLTSKYRELLPDYPQLQAMQIAVQQSGRSILTSALALTGATVAVSALSKIRMAGQMCAMLGMGAIISMLTIILVLPGLLLLCQPVLEATSLRWPRPRHKKPEENVAN